MELIGLESDLQPQVSAAVEQIERLRAAVQALGEFQGLLILFPDHGFCE